MKEAERSVDAFIGVSYNQQRLYQAPGYQAPYEFEQAGQQRRAPIVAESSCP